MVVGQRGEKRLVKVEERESNREWRTQPTRGGRGRGRGRGGHNLDRTKRVRPEDEMEEEERPRARAKQYVSCTQMLRASAAKLTN